MAEPVEEAVLEHLARLLRAAASGSRAPRRRRRRDLVEVGARRCPGFDRGDRAVERLLAEPVLLEQLVRKACRRRTSRVMSAKQPDSRSRGKRSRQIGSSGAIGPEPMSWPTAVCAPCETMNSSAKAPLRGERLLDRELDPLAGERLAVEHQAAVLALGRAQQVAGGVHRRLGGALGAADPGELGLVLHAPAPDEVLAVGRELDPVRAQVVGDARAGRSRARRPRSMPKPAARAQDQLELDLLAREPLRESSSIPNSSSGMRARAAARPRPCGRARTSSRRRTARRPAPRRGTGPEPRAAPRAASPASGSMSA